MLKGALVNLSKNLSSDNYSSKEISQQFNLSAYQRALMISGIKCHTSDIPVEEGINAMSAIEKHNILPNNQKK